MPGWYSLHNDTEWKLCKKESKYVHSHGALLPHASHYRYSRALTEVEPFDSCRLTMPSSSPMVTPLCVQVITGGGLPVARHSSVTLECSSIVASAGDLMMTGGTVHRKTVHGWCMVRTSFNNSALFMLHAGTIWSRLLLSEWIKQTACQMKCMLHLQRKGPVNRDLYTYVFMYTWVLEAFSGWNI